MSDTSQRITGPSPVLAARHITNPVLFGALVLAADLATILGAAMLSGSLYHLAAYGNSGPLALHFRPGLMAALFFTLPFLFRGKYRLTSFITGEVRLSSLFLIWNYAFLAMITASYLAHEAQLISRGSMVLFYFLGFALVATMRTLLTGLVQQGCRAGRITARQVMLVGTARRIAEFRQRHRPWDHGLRIVHAVQIDPRLEYGERDGDERFPTDDARELDRLLEDALGLTRRQRVDDVVLLLPWSRRHLVDRCVSHFINSSVSIHLGPEPIFDRFIDAHLDRLGTASTLTIVRPPLSTMELALKRGLDILGAGLGLLLLSPVLLAAAVLIRLDSPGPALFRQTRYGFNFEPFQIIKFRTMTVMEDGPGVKQAVANDPRITRVGAFLRRWNIDELPQLINVLKGDMSLVGPRPHAVAHDHEFAGKIAEYARRLNVRPGITGLAQVNGFRGPTDTDEKIRRRVEHDLYYIDNWSLWLDLSIIVMTVLSRRAYHNAL
jgi:Undecaprenyl-phosphate glucose phosphotransferase